MMRRDNELLGRNTEIPAVPGRKVFKTVKKEGVYAPAGSTVFYAEELVDISFTEEAGDQEISTSDGGNFEYIRNDSFLPEGSVVEAAEYYGYWLVFSVPPCPAKNEIFQVFMLGQPTSGTFQFGVDGISTADIPYASDGTAVQTAMELMSNIGAGNVQCTGDGFPEASMYIEFIGDLEEMSIPPMHCNNDLVGIGTGIVIVPWQTGGPNEF